MAGQESVSGARLVSSKQPYAAKNQCGHRADFEAVCESIGEDHTMVLKHERKTMSHAVMFLMLMLASPAISKDFGILTRMLYVAFLAEQGVALCMVADPTFASETSGPMGYMRDYAQHTKAEVTAGLNETETLSLVKSAADRAKGETLQALRSLRTEGPEGPENDTAWCQTVVKPLVRQVIDTHDNHHAQIDQLLEKAQKD